MDMVEVEDKCLSLNQHIEGGRQLNVLELIQWRCKVTILAQFETIKVEDEYSGSDGYGGR